MVRHIIEIIWCRNRTGASWKDLLQKWRESQPDWVNKLLIPIEKRLLLQTQLTVQLKEWKESDIKELKTASPVAPLWLFHTTGRKRELHQHIALLELHELEHLNTWRTTSDYRHINEGRIGAEKAETGEKNT